MSGQSYSTVYLTSRNVLNDILQESFIHIYIYIYIYIYICVYTKKEREKEKEREVCVCVCVCAPSDQSTSVWIWSRDTPDISTTIISAIHSRAILLV